MLKLQNGDSFVIADIPGIIEGASEGVGLGLKFLRHIERTRILLHVIDVSGLNGRNAVDDFNKINNELKKYNDKLINKVQIVVANKIDIMQDKAQLEELKKVAKERNLEFFAISGVTKKGVDELMNYTGKLLKNLPKEDIFDCADNRVVYTLEDEEELFNIEKIKDTEFYVSGPAIERLMGRVNIGNNESMAYLQRSLKSLGVEDKLKEMGVTKGDTIRILEWYFEYED